MKTKILNLLAALALTAAALATPSAFGYGAYAVHSGSAYGFIVNTTSIDEAMRYAIDRCDALASGGNSCEDSVMTFTNECLAFFNTAGIGFFLNGPKRTGDTGVDTIAAENCVTLDDCLPNNMPVDLSEQGTIEVCDHTCVAADNQFIVDEPSDNAGCRPARTNTECGMVDSATPIFDEMLGDNGECRAALECGTSTDGEGRTTDGGCETCPEDEFNNQCVAACVSPETRDTDGNCVDMTDNGGGDIDLTQMASPGLIQLAVTGSPNLLNTEIEDSTIDSISIQADSFLYDCPNTDRIGNTGRAYTGNKIGNGAGRKESLVSRGLRLADGTELTMIHPDCSYDHFVIQYPDGKVERWDVGEDEKSNGGDGIPFLLESSTLANGNDGDTDDQETTPPEFTIGTGGMTVAVSETNPIQVDNADVLEISITVATTVSGFMYTKDGGDDELVVSNDGVVGFTSTVAADEYEIFVAAVQNNTVAATISVYLTVAAANDSGNDGNNGGTVAASSGGGGGGSAGLIIGGVVVGGILIYVLSGGTADDVFWSPQYAFEWHNGKSLYSYGSRWDYHKENLNVYWTAANNTAGDWQYGSGATWHGDILTASYDSIGDGTMADADLSLMAHKTIGNWALQSGIRSNIQIQESGTSTSHRVNAEAIFRRDDDWKVSTVIGRYDRYFSVYMLFTKKL